MAAITGALIAAGIGAAGSIAASKSASNAAKSSAAASQQAADYATAEQARQYDQTRSDQMPWLNTGKGALNVLAQQYGIDSNTGTYNPSMAGNFNAFQASPDYQFRLNEGQRALTARNSALGIQDSGAAQRSALSLGQNLASGEYANWTNRLSSLAGVGQTAAQNLAGAGQNYANSVGNIAGQNAQNLASSYQQKASAQQGLYGGLAGIGTGLIQNYWPTSPKTALAGLY